MSSAFSTAPNQPYEYLTVRIDDVDQSQRVVHARDRTGAMYTVSYRDSTGGITLIPSNGEIWIAIRKGYTWFLDSRMDSADEDAVLATYQPGDLRVQADGAIRMLGTSLTFNGHPVGGAGVTDQFEHPATGYTSVTLSQKPLEADKIAVYLNGLLLNSSLWTWDGNVTINFGSAMGEAGYLSVVYEPA